MYRPQPGRRPWVADSGHPPRCHWVALSTLYGAKTTRPCQAHLVGRFEHAIRRQNDPRPPGAPTGWARHTCLPVPQHRADRRKRTAKPEHSAGVIYLPHLRAEARAQQLGVGDQAGWGAGADRGCQVVAVGAGGSEGHPVGAGDAAVDRDVGLEDGDRGLRRRPLDPVGDPGVVAKAVETGERLVDELVEVELRVAVDPERGLAEAVLGDGREARALGWLGPPPGVGEGDREPSLLDELRVVDDRWRLRDRLLAPRSPSSGRNRRPRRRRRRSRRSAGRPTAGHREAPAAVAERVEAVREKQPKTLGCECDSVPEVGDHGCLFAETCPTPAAGGPNRGTACSSPATAIPEPPRCGTIRPCCTRPSSGSTGSSARDIRGCS